MAAAGTLLTFAEWWLYCGLALAILFLAFGLDRIDESARGAFIFRAMLIPGLVLLWPIALWRWIVLARGADSWIHRHRPPLLAHGKVWGVLAVVIPLVFLAAMLAREPNPYGLPPPEKIGEADQ